MFPLIDTKDPIAVAAFVRSTSERIYTEGDFSPIAQRFTDVTDMFADEDLDNGAFDLRHHGFSTPFSLRSAWPSKTPALSRKLMLPKQLSGDHARGARIRRGNREEHEETRRSENRSSTRAR